jgi:argininosuccinate lyase
VVKRDFFLEEARLGPRSPVLIEYDEAPRLIQSRERFRAFAVVDLAHTVMMIEVGILTRDRGAMLLAGLLEILDLGADGFPWEPRSGSYLVQVERYLEQRFGHDVAGRLQTGRSRNDQDAAADRVFLRDALLAIIEDLLALERALLTSAPEYTHAIMPGYTHLQHAQPSTFAHYLLREISVFERDLQRLEGAFARTNQSVLGGAALVGTSWPVNRRRVAELLGHDGLVINASDAGAFARDMLEEDIAVLALMMSNLGRLATDLYVWHSWEFSFVEIADGLAATSSIMPQKKNPHALERVKALGGQAAGWLPTIMGTQRGVLSTDLDAMFGDDIVAQAARASRASIRLMTEVVRSLTVRRDVMAQQAGAFWSTASNLADELVRRFDLSFRTAHHVVGRFVRHSIQAGQGPSAASPELLRQAANEMAGRDIILGATELRQMLDPWVFIETRVSEGSVNPNRVTDHINLMNDVIAGHTDWHKQRTQRVTQALALLEREAHSLAVASQDHRRP